MKTKLSVLLLNAFLIISSLSSLMAQVTIGTNEPPQKYSVLEVVSGTSNTGGLRLPQLSDADKTAINADLLANPDKSKGLLIYSTANEQLEFWDGTKWVAAKGGTGSVTIPTEPWRVSGDGAEATLNTQNIYQMGQVTVGSASTAEASAAFNVNSANKGVLFPKVTLTGTTDATTVASPATGLLVYNTGTNSGFDYAGYVIWDGAKWAKISTDVTIPAEPWLVSATTDQATSNTQNIYQMGSVAIGYDGAVDPTAVLNVTATDKGVLLPRVALTSSTDKITITNPTTGLLVYNTGTDASFTTVGYMFWDGSAWKLFANASSEVGVATLNCSGAGMSPGQQIVGGTAIVDGSLLQIPYKGSNGGSFTGATLVSTGNPNVTATISGGMLSVGNGMLNFSLSGMPTVDQQAPNGITFDLTPFLTANSGITGCDEVVIGNVLTASIEEIAVMGYLMKGVDADGIDCYALQCNSPDGKFSIRVHFPGDVSTVAAGDQRINIQVRNNESIAQTVIWNFNTTWAGGNVAGANTLTMPSKRWGGNNSDAGGTWYSNTTTHYSAYWGNIGIYDGGGTEYRRYTWIPLGAENNVSYEIHAMAALDTPTPAVAVSPTKLKVYIKFTQVTAAK